MAVEAPDFETAPGPLEASPPAPPERKLQSQATVRFGKPAAKPPVADDPSHTPTLDEIDLSISPKPFGNYDLLGELGRGGMGVIYRARHRTLGRIVALKINRNSGEDSPDGLRRFQTEAAAVAKLDHPGIVPIYEVGVVDGQQYYSMAYVEGQSLAAAVASSPMPPRRAAEIVRAVAEAVAYAHAQGVVHRDLKPENVLVDAAGRPRVTDFGVAKFIGDSTDHANLTHDGEAIGTPSYMPPEQALGHTDQVGPLSDVYSLGATLYCLLTGRPPFQAATSLDTFRLVVEREPVPPRQWNAALDRDLETIALKCLEKRADKRYSSARALADDLGRWLDRKPILARPIGRAHKLARWCRRNPGLATTTAAMVAVLAAAFGAVSYSYLRASQARDEAIAEKRKGRLESYIANLTAVSSALQSNNVPVAFRALEAAPPEHRSWEWFHFRRQLDRSERVFSHLGVTNHTALFLDEDRILIDGEALEIRSVATGERLHAFTGGLRPAQVVVALDRTKLAYPTTSNAIRVCFLDRHRVVRTLDIAASVEPPVGLSFSFDGKRLHVVDRQSVFVRAFDVGTGQLLQAWRRPALADAENFERIHYDFLVYYRHAGNTFDLWSIAGEKLHRSIGPLQRTRAQLSISPDLSRLAAAEGYPDNVVRLFDVPFNKLIARIDQHQNECRIIECSQNNELFLTGSFDQTLRTWTRNGKSVATMVGHAGWVSCADIDGPANRVISFAQDRTIRLWNARTGEPLAVLFGHRANVQKCVFSPKGTRFLSYEGDGDIRIWNTARLEREGVLRGHENFVYAVAFFPDGKRVASGSWDGTVRVWDIESSTELARFNHGKNTAVASVAVTSDGKYVAALDRLDSVVVWDLQTKQRARQWRMATGSYLNSRIAIDDRRGLVLAAANDGKVHRLHIATGNELPPLQCSGACLHDVVVDPLRRWIAVGGAGSEMGVLLWDVNAEAPTTPMRVLKERQQNIYAVAVSKDGSKLICGSSQGAIHFWDTQTWRLERSIQADIPIYSLCTSKDDKRLFIGNAERSIRILDIESGLEVTELRGHSSYVHALSMSADGSQLASASGDGTVRIWDTKSLSQRTALDKQTAVARKQ